MGRWRASLSLCENMPRRVDKEELAQDLMADARAKAKRHEAAIAFTQLGQPAKAVNRLVSLGMAPDTPAVEATMRSKFVEPPACQQTSRRPSAPPANVLTENAVGKAISSFK
jgi:thioredoxin-like negative regulator of GroEL